MRERLTQRAETRADAVRRRLRIQCAQNSSPVAGESARSDGVTTANANRAGIGGRPPGAVKSVKDQPAVQGRRYTRKKLAAPATGTTALVASGLGNGTSVHSAAGPERGERSSR
jgi:hypothetical protein